MWCETYSESPRLIPETAMQAFQRPPKTLPRVPEGRAGHEKNWLDAIRQKGQAVSNFDYAGPFTETVLLGNVALRYPGQRLLWDAATMKVTNMPEADQFVQHNYRPGWSLRRRPAVSGMQRRPSAARTFGQLKPALHRSQRCHRSCLLPCVPMSRTSTAGSGSTGPGRLARRAAVLARGDEHRVRGVRRAPR